MTRPAPSGVGLVGEGESPVVKRPFAYKVVAAGDSAVLIICGTRISKAAQWRIRWVIDQVRAHPQFAVMRWIPGYTALLGRIDASKWRATDVAARLEEFLRQRADGRPVVQTETQRIVEIPVSYGGQFGPDLAALARAHEVRPDQLAQAHADVLYQVYLIGFVPGFPYLAGLPKALTAPRHSEPRVRVPAGSVGIGGRQTGIYPRSTPGGWQLIGRTPVNLFDIHREDPFLLQPGDVVKFTSLAADEFELWGANSAAAIEPLDNSASRALRSAERGAVEVIRSGLLTTVQDLGRVGYEDRGVAQAGAADRFAASIANLLVGNTADAAVLECTLVGPTLRFRASALVAITGGDLAPTLDGQPIPMWQTVEVAAGRELRFGGYRSGCRAYVAIAGGVEASIVMGSRSTDLAQGFGGHHGRALRAGDELSWYGAGTDVRNAAGGWKGLRGRALPHWARPTYETRPVIGYLPSQAPSRVADAVARRFAAGGWTVLPQSDRMGIRLHRADHLTDRPRNIVSEPVQPGTIQCPPSGQPIVLMTDAQTVGGYPTIGVVCTADLSRLAQARPGGEVTFQPVSESEARAKLQVQLDCMRWLTLANLAHR